MNPEVSQVVPKVAVVVLSYQSADWLAQFLPGIVSTAAARPTGDTEVWVVDNASTDRTPQLLAEQFPTVQVLTLKVNRGFTNGYIESLPQIQAEYYVLINSDVEVTPGWLDAPVDLLDSRPEIAAVQPKILAWRQRDSFEYSGAAGGYMDVFGYPFCRGRVFLTVEQDKGQYDDARPVFWGSGACLFIRAKDYHEVGGLDNTFYAHMEEIDLCWRLQNRGRQIWVCPQSTVYHVGGSIIQYNSPQKIFLNYRNGLAMLLKNAPGWPWLRIFCRLCLDGVSGVKSLTDGHWRTTLAIFRAHIGFYRRVPAILRERKAQGPKRPRTAIKGWVGYSAVWKYYVRGMRTFTGIDSGQA